MNFPQYRQPFLRSPQLKPPVSPLRRVSAPPRLPDQLAPPAPAENSFIKTAVYVPLETLSQTECMKKLSKWTFKDKIATGGYGSIAHACKKKIDAIENCKYVVKVQNLDYDRKGFEREIKIFKILEKAHVTPKLIDAWECKFKIKLPGFYRVDRDDIAGSETMRLSYLILEKWGGNLQTLITKQNGLKKSQLAQIIKLVKKMHAADVIHRDLFLRNILWREKMVKRKGALVPTMQFAISDFGASYYTKDPPIVNNPVVRFEVPIVSSLVPEYDWFTLKKSFIESHGIDVSKELDPFIQKNFKEPKPVYPVLNKNLLPG